MSIKPKIIMMRLPKTVSPCPVLEAIFEMRFESELPQDAIFGVLYNQFRETYKSVAQLPILQLPQVVRSQDPNLIWAPHYKLTNDKSTIQIGPKVFSLAWTGEYIGWERFSKEIISKYEKVIDSNVVSNTTRLALRYVNIFEDTNISKDSDFNAHLGDLDLSDYKINFSAEIPSEKSVSQLKIINSAEAILSGKRIKGSLIDIDSAVNLQDFDNFSDAIEFAHNEEKQLFFKVLGENLIGTMNPEYGD